MAIWKFLSRSGRGSLLLVLVVLALLSPWFGSSDVRCDERKLLRSAIRLLRESVYDLFGISGLFLAMLLLMSSDSPAPPIADAVLFLLRPLTAIGICDVNL